MTKENMINACPLAFNFCEIHNNGAVYPCCPAYCKFYEFGNLNTQDFEEIFRSEKAKIFREKILNNDYSLCDLQICAQRYKLINKEEAEKAYLPKHIKMCWDMECNAACITCRNKLIRNDAKELEKLKKIEEKILPYIGSLEEITLSGEGDPFGSRYCQEFIKKVAELNPNIIFNLHTNGALCSESMVKKLGIYDRIGFVHISIHAATKETYDKIVRFSNFNQVWKNIEWLAKRKQEGKVRYIDLTFVTNNFNYQEMNAFAELAHKYGATAGFRLCRDWGSDYTKDKMDKVAIWNPEHPEHWKFLKEISTLDIKSGLVFVEKNIRDLISFDIEERIKYYKKRSLLTFIKRLFKTPIKKIEKNIRKIMVLLYAYMD